MSLLGLPALPLALSITTVSVLIPLTLSRLTASSFLIGVVVAGEGLLALLLPLWIGPLSDRTRSALGGRLPYVIAGTIVCAVALAILPFAASLLVIAALVMLFNLGYFVCYPTYRALYPDVYTDPQDPFVDPEQRSVYRYVYENDPKARAFVVDTRAQARFATGAVRHLAIAGVDYTWSRVTGRSGFGFDDRPFDLFSPVYLGIEAPELADNPELELKQLGFYAQDQMTFAGRWHAVLGIRHDEAETRSEGSAAVKDHATTWRAGLLYDLDDGLAPYASYTESFLPVGYADFYGQPYQAQRGKQRGFGVERLLVAMSVHERAALR